jgi:hypothetical protein
MLARSNGYKFIDADFTYTPKNYGLPSSITNFISSYNPAAVERTRNFTATDVTILVVMQKSFDIAFVPPIDVPTGAQTDIEVLKKRYWTVFDPGVFD